VVVAMRFGSSTSIEVFVAAKRVGIADSCGSRLGFIGFASTQRRRARGTGAIGSEAPQ